MNKLWPVLLLLIFSGIGIYLFYTNYYKVPCDVNSTFALCTFDKKSNSLVQYKSNMWKCDDIIFYRLNLDKVNTPQSYYLCVNGIKLVATNVSSGDFKLSKFDSTTNMEFTCVDKIYSKPENGYVADFGRIPDVSGKITFLEVYAYPSDFKFNSVEDFINNKQSSMLVYSYYGEVSC
ncbi:MAG TPA: hypothetical protein VJJ76_00195 [archaeon]|nr:hypothetical protein [archaeon]